MTSREEGIAALVMKATAGIHELGMPCVLIVVDETDDGEASPHVSLRGNMTAAFIAADALMSAAMSAGRPGCCVQCMDAYDRIVRAQAALNETVGEC